MKTLKKYQFSGVGRTVRALGADDPRVFDIYLISEIFGKSFRENALPGGQSAGLLPTVRYSLQNRTEHGAARWTGRTVRGLPADSPRGPGGRSAGPTASPANRWLRVFTVGIQTRTVREVRILPITASNEKEEYIYSMPGIGEVLLAL
jgi:hypothetical protein